ncbi:MAG: MotA/TolQ/ExbB proton channel family protein [Cyanobacteria bacterium P01_F01_bin.42]
MEIIELLRSGGLVMLPLGVFSILAIAFIAERFYFWRKIELGQSAAVSQALKKYRDDDREATLKSLERNLYIPIIRVYYAVLELDALTPEEFHLALETEAQAELPGLKRFSAYFETVITTSPLLGLLGTVTGLIRSFSSLDLGNIGGSDSLRVTGGISEALVSTATGLLVAIVTLIFSNAFRVKYRRQVSELKEYGGQLELIFLRKYTQEESAKEPITIKDAD